MSDKDLTEQEQALAAVAMDVAGAIEDRSDSYWAEDHTPPDTEDDVLTSVLYTRPGDPVPEAGFTLWAPGDVAYRISIKRLEQS